MSWENVVFWEEQNSKNTANFPVSLEEHENIFQAYSKAINTPVWKQNTGSATSVHQVVGRTALEILSEMSLKSEFC